jgi:hypothetical protein
MFRISSARCVQKCGLKKKTATSCSLFIGLTQYEYICINTGVDQRRPAAIDQGGELVPRGDQPAVGSGGRVHQPAHQEPGRVQ